MAWYCAIDIVQPQIDTDHKRIFVRKPKYIKPTSYIGKNKIIQALDDIAAVLSGSSAVVRDYTYTDMQPNILIDQGKKARLNSPGHLRAWSFFQPAGRTCSQASVRH